jgi:hypothetical protein
LQNPQIRGLAGLTPYGTPEIFTGHKNCCSLTLLINHNLFHSGTAKKVLCFGNNPATFFATFFIKTMKKKS